MNNWFSCGEMYAIRYLSFISVHLMSDTGNNPHKCECFLWYAGLQSDVCLIFVLSCCCEHRHRGCSQVLLIYHLSLLQRALFSMCSLHLHVVEKWILHLPPAALNSSAGSRWMSWNLSLKAIILVKDKAHSFEMHLCPVTSSVIWN